MTSINRRIGLFSLYGSLLIVLFFILYTNILRDQTSERDRLLIYDESSKNFYYYGIEDNGQIGIVSYSYGSPESDPRMGFTTYPMFVVTDHKGETIRYVTNDVQLLNKYFQRRPGKE